MAPSGAIAQDKVVRILAIGNSFSQDAVEQYLYELADAEGIHVIVGNGYIGGCSLETHVNNLRNDKPAYAYRKVGLDGKRVETPNMTIAKMLADEQWDYVSLQQASPLSGKYDTYAAHLPELADYVRARVGKTTKLMLHQTWAYSADSDHSGFRNYDRDQMKMYTSIGDAVQKAAKLIGVKTIIPSGTAIQNARTSFIGDNMNRDGYHLDLLYGRYTAACTWFEKIFGKSVVGNKYAPDGITADVKEVAQRAAHEAVKRPFAVTTIKVKQLPVVYTDAASPIEARVEDLLSRMTVTEKIYQLNQQVLGRNDNVNNIGDVIRKIPAEMGSLIYFGDDAVARNAVQKHAMENSRLGIPILFGFDVIHGFRTIYPISLAQSATWNPDLVRRACEVAAQEAYSTGVDWTFSPMVDVARDGRWGRISEGYGEDPYVNSVYSVASVKGYQGDDLSAENSIAACLKHYVGYGASEAGRDYVPTEISAQTLWDTYLPSFEAGVRAGAVTLMSSFNTISGIPGSANHYTMTEILKDKWGHEGFIIADWNAIGQLITQGLAADKKEAARYAMNAGLDIDMMGNCYQPHLEALMREGRVGKARVDDAVRRVLRVKFMLGLFEKPYTDEKPENERFMLPASVQVAEELAQESFVLLKNDNNTLPLRGQKRIALIGPLATNQADLLGSWYARGRAEDVVSIFDGLAAEMNSAELIYAAGCDFDGEEKDGFAEALAAAKKSDVVVLCLGEKRGWSGENASRSTIALPAIQEELLARVREAGKPVVVLLSSGRPLDLTRIAPMADAVMEIWQPGVTGGKAVAGILSGRYNPSGKLTITFPYTTGQIPIYYNHRNSGRNHQGMYQDIPSTPLYDFGHGLSYTTFEYGTMSVSTTTAAEGTPFTAEVTVTNTGSVDGKESVLWYICDPYCSITRPVKELKYFEKDLIKAGESRKFTFEIDPLRDLGFVDNTGRKFLEAGDYYIIVNDQRVKITVNE